MKKTLLTLSLVAALAACNRGPANNVAAGNNVAAPAPVNSAAAAPAPAEGAQQAAMPPGLDCIRNRLSPEQRRAVAQAAMEQASRDDPRAQPLVQATDACAEQLSWSPQKRRLAGMFSISAAGAAGIREELGSQGVRIEDLDRLILADSELLAAAEIGQLDSNAGSEFAQRHLSELQQIANGQSLEGELGTRIGNYIAFRALAETTASQFGREH
jgi:hypothetical protein